MSIRYILSSFLRRVFLKIPKGKNGRVYLKDDLLVVLMKNIVVDQQRAEQEVHSDIIKVGIKVLENKDEYVGTWDALSQREQQITALTCMGYRNYEIADLLGISYETVLTHSRHVYAKFKLNRKELRLALKDWDFQKWLNSSQA